jgi:hypothetical protein
MDPALLTVNAINLILLIVQRLNPFLGLLLMLSCYAALDYVNSNYMKGGLI